MPTSDLVTRVVSAVAAADGVAPAELDPLYDHVDPATLETLAANDRGTWSFTFQYGDHQVTITDDSEILVDGRPPVAGQP
jgi:hypothetical protein